MKKKFWKDRKVFITGSTGLLGHWITKYLVKSEAEVTALVRKEVPKPFHNIFSDVRLVKGTVLNYDIIKAVLKKHKIQTVFHLAAQTISPIANEGPRSTFETNIQGTWTMLEACRNVHSIQNIIVASSDKAYGEADVLPYTEESRLTGKHPYTVSKSCADLIATAYFSTYGLPICITRCGNFFGGGDLLFDRLVPSVVKAVLFNEQLLIRSDGKIVRDFFYVEDAALATLLLAKIMCHKKNILGDAFNFSYELPMTVIDFVDKILKIMKSSLTPTILNIATNEIRKQYLSSKKARKLLGWKPQFTVEKGIERTIQWYIDYFNKYNVR